jgi:hypothetical protein
MARRPRPTRIEGQQAEPERRDGANRDGATGGLVVARLDRFGRSVQDSANLLARIRAADGVLCTVAEGIDTSGYMGKFLADLFAALGELELARIRENWDTARKSAVARGIHVSGKVPTGYRRNEDRVLEPDPRVGPVIHELFHRRAAGVSWAQLARFLEEEGVVTPWDNKNWTVASIGRIVRNRVYLGEARAGKIVNPDAHEPIVNLAEWQAANKARGVHPGRSGKGTGLLSGVLRCGGCSYAMKPKMGRTRHGKDFLEYSCKPRQGRRALSGAGLSEGQHNRAVRPLTYSPSPRTQRRTVRGRTAQTSTPNSPPPKRSETPLMTNDLPKPWAAQIPMCTCARLKAARRGRRPA